MEGEQREDLWPRFQEEMKKYLSTPTFNNEILNILNDDRTKRFNIKVDDLPKA